MYSIFNQDDFSSDDEITQRIYPLDGDSNNGRLTYNFCNYSTEIGKYYLSCIHYIAHYFFFIKEE